MTRYRHAASALCLLALTCAPALAQETPLIAPQVAPLAAPLAAASEAAEMEAMPLDDLASVAAGESVKVDVLSTQDLSASNSGNSVTADTVTNGDISFSPGALTGFSGVGNFVSNTGNNNNLQGSISITIVTTPGLN